MSEAWSIAIDAIKLAGTRRARVRGTNLLATVSLLTLGCGWTALAASDCASGPPAKLASPSQLFERLRTATNVQLLTIGLLSRQAAGECDWTYEVKMLTASGSVVELEFGAGDLNLVGASGPANDRDAAALVRSFPGGANLPITGGGRSGTTTSSATSGRDDDGGEAGGSPGSGSGGSAGSGGSDNGGSSGGGNGGGEDGGGSDDGGSEDGGSEGGDAGGNGGEAGGGDD